MARPINKNGMDFKELTASSNLFEQGGKSPV